MKERAVHFVFLPGLMSILFTACNLAPASTAVPSTPSVTQPLPSPSPTFTPIPTATSIPEPTVTPTARPSPAPVIQSTSMALQIPVMPEGRQDGMSTNLGMMLSQFLGQEIVVYSAPTSLEAVADFYQTQLAAQGWEWVYTDLGESLVMTDPMPILIQEFKQESEQLAIAAIADFGNRSDTPVALVFSSQNISGGELLSHFVSLMAGGFDLGPPSENDVQPQAMHFTSPLIQFDHPSNWLPTHLQMVSFQTDTGDRAINVLREPRRCTSDDETCFINFAFLTRSLFDVPIMIRLYSLESEITLEAFDAQRWAELVEGAGNPSGAGTIHRPEDLIAAGSLETVEVKPITLHDGTPALQHIYSWQQVNLSTPLLSTYTLLKRDNTIIEFHTDFTEEEWAILGPSVQETILSVEVVQ